jgi:Kef-type K+ transport system membrane component KefB
MVAWHRALAVNIEADDELRGERAADGALLRLLRPVKIFGCQYLQTCPVREPLMTMLRKLSCLYAATLIVACAAIVSVLHFGAALPHPRNAIAPERTMVVVTPAESSIAGLTRNLSAHLVHPLSNLLVQLFVIVVLSQVAGRICRRIGQPAVVGEIVAGILLGPSLLGFFAPEAFAFVFPADSLETLRLLSQIGVCLFMFVMGMHLDVKQVQTSSRVAIAVSHVSIAFPYLLGVLVAYFLFGDLAGPGTTFTGFALFMGISMSITAFPVLARILQERGMLRSSLGSTAMTCAAVDDVTAWTLLAFIVASSTATSFLSSTLNMILVLVFIAIMVLGVRRALPLLLGQERMTREKPSHSTLAFVLCLVIASSLSTEVIGIHALFGAFLAGAIMPDVGHWRRSIGERIEAFSSVLLLPLFFAFTGLRTQIALLQDIEGWSICLLITGVATLGKLGGSAAAARLTGMSWPESLQLGALMNTRGLMELIALNIGYDLGILSPRIFTMLVIMAVLTTTLTGPLLTLFRGRKYGIADDLPETSRM